MTKIELEEFNVTIGSLTVAMATAGNLLTKLEKAQKDLEKLSPHKWEHGDVFREAGGCEMIFITCSGFDTVYCVSSCTGHKETRRWTENAEFLFNIKEKL